jgi:hypothetical protein
MKQQLTAPDSIEHISEKPWSDYTKADYTPEQWHAACLIHFHDGPPTSKEECKLPVKTPNGALNRNGVHAAASVLAGGRGGVNAPADKIAAAKRSIVRLYGELGEKPPPSMTHSTIENILEHFGVKGMRWGVRRSRSGVTATSPRVPKQFTSADFRRTQTLRGRKPQQLTNKQLKDLNERMNLEQNYKRMNPRTIDRGHNRVKYLLAFGTTAATAGGLAAKFLKTPAGQRTLNKGRSVLVGKGLMKATAKRVIIKEGESFLSAI